MGGRVIDWPRVAYQLTDLAGAVTAARLFSVTLPLPCWPALSLPNQGTRQESNEGAGVGDWCFWQRPEHTVRLLGFGKAVALTSAGAGRFAALHAAQRGLLEGWHYPQRAGAAVPPPLAFCGFAFAPHGGGPLPNASLWVPELLLREQAGRVWLTLSCTASQAHAALAHWRARWQAVQTTGHTPVVVPPAPTFTVWPNPLADAAFLARGRAALRAIATGRVDKLVLTRAMRLKVNSSNEEIPLKRDEVRPLPLRERVEERGGHAHGEGNQPCKKSPNARAAIAITPLLAALAAQHPACATFGIGQAGKRFVGASPETLLTLDGPHVSVDALAGTAWQASALALGADKNRREHDFVAQAVAAALATVCHDIVVPAAPEVLQLNALSHLRRRVTAQRPPGVSAFDLIARLHPTPAVGGAPSAAALDWLARHGDRRAAWYTGGIGWIDAAGNCDIAVALRCGLIEENEVTLYAGAGFVAGSDPAQELAETEAKFSALRAALVTAASTTRASATGMTQEVA